ncbi:MAG: hypothetical protein IJL26_10960 [Clostridia bacterium]|nr:hypothetical protein [Clostridia bacterium]
MRGKTKRVAACILLLAAVCLFALGISEGGYSDVANKARAVCFECIGIG